MDLLEIAMFLKVLEERVDELKKLEKREGMNAYNGYTQSQILFEVLDEKIMSYRNQE